MNWLVIPALTNLSDVVTVLGGVAAAGGVAYRVLRKMRSNDLHHLDLKMDRNHEATLRIETKLDRQIERLDEHVQAHAEGRFDNP